MACMLAPFERLDSAVGCPFQPLREAMGVLQDVEQVRTQGNGQLSRARLPGVLCRRRWPGPGGALLLRAI